MGGVMSRNKGKGGEREVRDLFRDALDGYMKDVEVIRRNHQQAEIGGADLVGVPHFSVEIKRVRKLPGKAELIKWWYQACEQARINDKIPCLVYRQDRGQWNVMLWMTPTLPRTNKLTSRIWAGFRPAVLDWDTFVEWLHLIMIK